MRLCSTYYHVHDLLNVISVVGRWKELKSQLMPMLFEIRFPKNSNLMSLPYKPTSWSTYHMISTVLRVLTKTGGCHRNLNRYTNCSTLNSNEIVPLLPLLPRSLYSNSDYYTSVLLLPELSHAWPSCTLSLRPTNTQELARDIFQNWRLDVIAGFLLLQSVAFFKPSYPRSVQHRKSSRKRKFLQLHRPRV